MITYVVSGALRSGTSMLMHCLNIGSELEVMYPEKLKDAYRIKYPKAPIPSFYEGEIRAVSHATKPASRPTEWDHLKGKCIRMLGFRILDHGLYPLRVVYITRNPDDRRISEKATFGLERLGGSPTQVERQIKNLTKSDEVETLTILDYDEVLANPEQELQKLADDGWPIDVKKAATGVDPTQKHF